MTWGWVCFFTCHRVSRALWAAYEDADYCESCWKQHATFGKRRPVVMA